MSFNNGWIDHATPAVVMPNTTPHPMHNQASGVIGPRTQATNTNDAKPTAAAAAVIRSASTVAAAMRRRRRYSASLPVVELTTRS